MLLDPKPPKVLPVLLLVWPKPPLPNPPPKDILKVVAIRMGSCENATDEGDRLIRSGQIARKTRPEDVVASGGPLRRDRGSN